jgi:tRNA-dihydrouridine synthase
MSPFMVPVKSATVTQKQLFKSWKDIHPTMQEGEFSNPKTGKLIPQFMGNQAEDFVLTAKQLLQWGYEEMNWNLGCPASQVVTHKRGCGLMPLPDRVEEVVAAVTGQTSIRFSVKMRLGLKEQAESEELIRRLNRYPLKEIVIHPRLGVQQYEGSPDWDALERLWAQSLHPIIYSGDIYSVADYQEFTARFPQIDQIMLGRGLLANPFLAEEIAQGSPLEHSLWMERFRNYYEDLCHTLLIQRGEKGALGNLKELWHYFALSLHLSPEQLTQLLRIDDFSKFIAFK